ncbi:hypothetical protein ES705_20559 [subsurface metagenome]
MGKHIAKISEEEQKDACKSVLKGHIKYARTTVSRYCVDRAHELERPDVEKHLDKAIDSLSWALALLNE